MPQARLAADRALAEQLAAAERDRGAAPSVAKRLAAVERRLEANVAKVLQA